MPRKPAMRSPKPTWQKASRFMSSARMPRHFLPAYLFLLILSTRCLALSGIGWRVIGWASIAATALHGAWHHPNYIAYTNFPRGHIWLKISDSNLEWGQSLKQVGEWVTSHPELNTRSRIY